MKYLGAITQGKDLVNKEYVDGKQRIWYGTSSTAAATQAKTVATHDGDFTLAIGNMVRVKFGYGNTYNGTATLNVDGTGAVNIATVGTDTTSRYFWKANEVVDFVYNGTNFVMLEQGTATTTYYGVTKLSSSTSSTSTALAATPSAVKAAYDLANGKQDALVSGTNIKTINGNSILGSGDITIQGGGVFLAEANVATFADVTDAISDGLAVYAFESIGQDAYELYHLTFYDDQTCMFISYMGSNVFDVWILDVSDTWINDTVAFSYATHSHGNLQVSGELQTTDVTIANGDKLVVTDASNSNKVARASIAFDGSTTNQFLSKKGTWESASGSGTSIPTANTVAEFDANAQMNSTDMTSAEVTTFVNSLNVSGVSAVDYVIENGSSGNWRYTKWNSGKLEQWYYGNPGAYTVGTARGNWYSGGDLSYTYPVAFVETPCINGSVSLGTSAYVVMFQFNGFSNTGCQGRIVAGSSISSNSNYWIFIHAVGKWK